MAASDDELGFRGDGGFLPPPTTPRRAAGGIRLQARTGGTAWWTRRWLAAFESAASGDRRARALDYARGGQVLELGIELGAITATVQGTRRQPYELRIELPLLAQDAWLRIADAFGGRAASRAALASGTLPDDSEATFRAADATVFPALEEDVRCTCSCDDWAVPCVHAMAACDVLGEALDREPLLILRLRGVEPDVLRALVAGRSSGAGGPDRAAPPAPSDPPVARASAPDADFWRRDPPDVAIDAAPPSIDAPLVRMLGAPRFWRGVDPFEPAMRTIYGRVATDARLVDLTYHG